jgi:hypothetical protein
MVSLSDTLVGALDAVSEATAGFLGTSIHRSGLSIPQLSDACRISERTLKSYLLEKKLGNFYPFSIVLIAIGAQHEDWLDALKQETPHAMPLFSRTGFARANAYFRKTSRNRSMEFRQRYHRVDTSIIHQSNDNYKHWENLAQIVAMAYDFNVSLGAYMAVVSEKSQERLLELLVKGETIDDDEFIIMDESSVDDFVHHMKPKLAGPTASLSPLSHPWKSIVVPQRTFLP